jgi:ribosome-binding factor A
MTSRRVFRLNSLLKEVISEVLRQDIHHIDTSGGMITVTSVEITADLSFAKVFISVIGDEKAKKTALSTLNDHAGQIGYKTAKKVVMRSFPKLQFFLDEGLEKQLRICEILAKVAPHDETPSS